MTTGAPARTEVMTCACGPTRRCYLCRPEMFQAYLKWQAYFARRALAPRVMVGLEPETERVVCETPLDPRPARPWRNAARSSWSKR
jgi:hypothetical protein